MNNNVYKIVCKKSDFDSVVADLQNIVNIYVFNSCSHDSARLKATNCTIFNKDNFEYVLFELPTWKRFIHVEDFAKMDRDERLRNRAKFLLNELNMFLGIEEAMVYYPLTNTISHSQFSGVPDFLSNDGLADEQVCMVDQKFVSFLHSLIN